MGEVVGEVLPLAVGVAISPLPIIAVILMLFAPHAGGTSFGFLSGWVAGIVVATLVFVWLAGTADLGDDEPSPAASWIKLLLGVVVLLLAVKQWRARPRPGKAAQMPKWMTAIDSFTPARSVGLGFLLSAVNPKNLAMCASAGVAITGGGTLTGEQRAIAVAVFTVLAACTVVVPVIAYAIAEDRMRPPLDRLKEWLQDHNTAVMTVLLLVIGVVLVGKGVGGLW